MKILRQFNCGFFYPLSLSFRTGKYFFLEPNISYVIFQGELLFLLLVLKPKPDVKVSSSSQLHAQLLFQDPKTEGSSVLNHNSGHFPDSQNFSSSLSSISVLHLSDNGPTVFLLHSPVGTCTFYPRVYSWAFFSLMYRVKTKFSISRSTD